MAVEAEMKSPALEAGYQTVPRALVRNELETTYLLR